MNTKSMSNEEQKLMDTAIMCIYTIIGHLAFNDRMIKEAAQWTLTAEKFKELKEEEVLKEALERFKYLKTK